MIQIRLSPLARRDLTSILKYSKDRFGLEAADAYESHILRAILLIRSVPDGPTVKPVEGMKNLRRFHLRLVPRSATKPVARPRHLIVFQIDAERLTVVRILHEKMDTERHLR